jgi:glycosyltransferase involved in cell wall biosynthesis
LVLDKALHECRFCVVVPHYNHAEQFGRFFPELMALEMPVLVVDDGSDPAECRQLRELLADEASVELLLLPANLGKGGAVIAGARHARELGYTHMLQVDADGQHAVAGVAEILGASRQAPDALISGNPVFSADIPAARLHGRKISLWWVRLETLSWQIEDVMCGFRVYPLNALLELCDRTRMSLGMQFDIEVLVRKHWAGVAVKFVPVPVSYPTSGRSHFHMFRDNLRISLMHARLCAGMLIRLPLLLLRKKNRLRPQVRQGETD